MRSTLKRISFGLGATYLAVCLLVFAFQRSLLYHPGAPPTRNPGELGLEWREVPLTTEDGEQLGAWLVEAEAPLGCILVSHGNGGSLQHRLKLAKTLVEMGFSCLLYDYRGYGESSGSPSEAGTYSDGTAAYEWLLANGWEPERIIFWGESLGGAVATELAARFAGAGLVLDHTFTSAVDIGTEVYPWLPIGLLARDRYETRDKIARLTLPILIVHSPQDELIPYEHAERLLAAAPKGTRLLVTEGAHNDPGFMLRGSYREQVRSFLATSVGGS